MFSSKEYELQKESIQWTSEDKATTPQGKQHLEHHLARENKIEQ